MAPRRRSHSAQTTRVLGALAEDPTAWHYGYDLSEKVGLGSGSLYPILMRLAERGLLEARWESGPPGRPPRHLYRLSGDGLGEVAELDRLRPSPRGILSSENA